MPILENLELTLSVDDVLRGEGADPVVIRARNLELIKTAELALKQGSPWLKPGVVYRTLRVESFLHERVILEGGGVLHGRLIGQHLARATQVVAVVCSVGQELEDRASEALIREPTYGLALDGLGSAAVEALANAACRYIEEQADVQGLKTSIPLSPGMNGWPVLEGQRQIFNLLNPAEIGVLLLPSGLMLPRKSLSMVIGLGEHIFQAGTPCEYCARRETCHYRSHYA